ncbi:DUF418 domain-containing protein [candidate division KSB1 bacterium]|nr:DUF418 domain-containing protein [candidate division KSB1 bacterium]
MGNQSLLIGPTPLSQRIVSLDVLRGFAVLGILIMNIQSYSMIEAAYINPAAYGDLTGGNKWVWIFSHIFADQKFMTLFSILFGAGIILLFERMDTSGRRSVPVFLRRIFWLFVIGMIHAYMLWSGDILVIYALCAIGAFGFRKKSPRFLLIFGLIVVSVASMIYLFSGASMPFIPPESKQGMLLAWKPVAESIQREIAALQGNWLAQMEHRIPSAIKFQTFLFLIFSSWRAGGLMLVGMALYKWGILSATRSRWFYTWLILGGLTFGLTMIVTGIVKNFEANWSLEYSMFLGSQFNYWGSLGIAAAYLGAIMLLCQTQWANSLLNPLAKVGRMALTNYLLQTIICTTIFYGHGFGLFGTVERMVQILIVFAIWAGQILFSVIWMTYFQMGPAEWLWRMLTYLKPPQLRASAPASAESLAPLS